MKFTTASALMVLATVAAARPADIIEERAVCTAFGYPYYCAETTTQAAATTTAKAAATTAAASTGGSSKYTTGSSATDIDNNTGCTELTVIFARGTGEGGNIGTVVGPPTFKQLLSDLGASKLTLQGVTYPADSAGNANCGAAGGAAMASEVKTILSRCPNTKIALSGYSQGACVVHNAVQSQGVSASSISAVVLFGKFPLRPKYGKRGDLLADMSFLPRRPIQRPVGWQHPREQSPRALRLFRRHLRPWRVQRFRRPSQLRR